MNNINLKRLRSLEYSRIQDQVGFPVSLILVTKKNQAEEVIGHSKAVFIHNQEGACYIESGNTTSFKTSLDD